MIDVSTFPLDRSVTGSIARTVCVTMGIVFVIVAIWGFIAGHQVLIFHVNTAHNLVHLISGILSLICGLASVTAARAFCLVFGAVYGLVAVLGFANVPAVNDLLHLNDADDMLHAVIAVVFLTAPFIRRSSIHPTA